MRNFTMVLICTLISASAFAGDNTISVIGGAGPNGTSAYIEALPSKDRSAHGVQNYGAVFGFQAERRIDSFSIGAMWLSNGTTAAIVGINF